MRLRSSLVAAVALVAALAAAQAIPASATDSPCTSGSGAASGARTCSPGDESAYTALEQRLGADLAGALSTQHKLAQAVNNAAASEITLSAALTLEESRVADLQNQVAQLDSQIADLESRIDVERAQISALARALYQRPTSFFELLASSGGLSQALSQATDMVIAGQRAHLLQERLKADLAQVQSDRDARQSALDEESAVLDQVQAGIAQLAGIQAQLDSLSGQLTVLLARIRTASAALPNQPISVTAALAQLLGQEQLNLAQQEQAVAWAEASVGSGLAADQGRLPTGTGPDGAGVVMSWPLAGGVITQPFGPTAFALEPPLGPYAHFHTGIDVSAQLGTPVLAAAGGLVIAVAHTSVGYGNYVIVAHGGGVLTLYAHLLATNAYVGEAVTRGQPIGLEGSTGFSTGPHLHFEVRVNGQVVDPMRFLPPI